MTANTTGCSIEGCACHLRSWALGLSIGILWGLCVLIMGLVAHYTPLYGQAFVTNVGAVYWGYYGPTVMGSIIGGLIGFVHGFIKGFLIAWLYNAFSSCCANCCRPVKK